VVLTSPDVDEIVWSADSRRLAIIAYYKTSEGDLFETSFSVLDISSGKTTRIASGKVASGVAFQPDSP
jgi:hypothetical protein